MSRKHFQNGLSFYKAGNFPDALEELNKAIKVSPHPTYIMYDTRAAVYAKLGHKKEALKDAKMTIEVAPGRWHGYARAARLFLDANKPDASATMVNMALDRTQDQDTERRVSLLSLQAEIAQATRDAEQRRRKYTNHIANLPVEIFGEIARILNQENHTAHITLSHVSKNWRSVVHNSPHLWDVLVLSRRRSTQKANLWIEKSKGRIRELYVREDIDGIYEWAELFLSNIKWEYLRTFSTQGWDPVPYLQAIGKDTALSHLQKFEVEDVGFNRIGEIPGETWSSLHHLALRRVLLRGFEFDNMIERLTNLRSLDLNMVLGQDHTIPELATPIFNRLLEANPMLESLSLVQMPNLKCSNAVLQHLTFLEVERLHNSILVADLPSLRVLRVVSPLDSIDDLLQHLATKSPPEGSQLTEIVLDSCPFKANSLISLMEKSPALQTLGVLNVTGVALAIVEALAASYSPTQRDNDSVDSPTLCPGLTHVNLSKCNDLKTGPLVRMIRSRLPPADGTANDIEPKALPEERSIKRIASLMINECPGIDAAWLEWIRKNVRSVSCIYMKKKTKFRA